MRVRGAHSLRWNDIVNKVKDDAMYKQTCWKAQEHEHWNQGNPTVHEGEQQILKQTDHVWRFYLLTCGKHSALSTHLHSYNLLLLNAPADLISMFDN